MGRRRVWLMGCGAMAALLVMVLAAAALLGRAGVPSGSLLVLDLSGELGEGATGWDLARLLEGRPDTVLGMRELLRAAAADPRIAALLVRANGLSVGLAKADELREQIRRFQESGKPAAAILEFGSTLDYYVASACRRVHVPPQGTLVLKGLLADMPYLRGTLDKLRIEPDFVAAGRYKTFPETFTRTGMSPAQREVLDSVLDEAYARVRGGIAEGRNLDSARVGALIDRALFNGVSAAEAGLSDGALYEDEVVDALQQAAGTPLTRLGHRQYRRQARADRHGAGIAVVVAAGDIVSGRSEALPGSVCVGSDTMAEVLREVREDDSLKAVVLRIDSPGGMAGAADSIWREISLTRERKPVVVSMSDVAASGGYWIAAPASRIVAQPLTLTGSIGVFAGKFNLQGLYRWAGVEREIVQRGGNADLFSDARPFTPAQRELLRKEIGAVYDAFRARVAQGRGLEPAAVEAAAQGRVWTGSQARERGLIDAVGGFDLALEEALHLANLPPDSAVRLEFYPRERTLLEAVLRGDLARAARALGRLARWLDGLVRALEGRGVAARAF